MGTHKTKLFECSCNGHAIRITHTDDDDPDICIEILGLYGKVRKLKNPKLLADVVIANYSNNGKTKELTRLLKFFDDLDINR